MAYAALVIVDNSGEDPEVGRRGLREDLLPVLRSMDGFRTAHLLTDYPRGRGVALVVFDSEVQALGVTSGLVAGAVLREGVVVTSAEVLEATVVDGVI
jgi:hypothetical protein